MLRRCLTPSCLLQGSMIPKPRFLQRRIGEVEIGTFRQIATVHESASVYEALSIFVERRVSALPVVDEQGGRRGGSVGGGGGGGGIFIYIYCNSCLVCLSCR